MATRSSRARGRIAGVLGAVVVVAACAGSGTSGPGTESSTSSSSDVDDTVTDTTETAGAETTTTLAPIDRQPIPRGESAADAVVAAREAAGGETVDTALLDFAAHFGPLPGVDAIERDGSIGRSPTHVFESIERFRGELTDEQETAVDAVLTAFFTEVEYRDVADLDPAGDDEPVPTAEGHRQNRARSSEPFSDDLWATPEELAKWEGWLREAERSLASVLGVLSLNIDYSVHLAALGVEHHEYEAATAVGLDESTGLPTCAIWIAEARRRPGAGTRQSALAHELFHCWFAFHVGHTAYVATPMWLREGLTTWAGDAAAGGVTAFLAGEIWPRYLQPTVGWSLFSSDYDAVGFWTAVDEQTSIGPRVPAYLTSTRFASHDERLAPVLGWVGADGAASIASAAHRLGVAGWDYAAGVPAISRVDEPVVVSDEIVQRSPSGFQYTVRYAFEPSDGGGGTLVDLAISGPGRYRWSDGTEVVNASGSQRGLHCLGGDCRCPDGSELPVDAIPIDGVDATLDAAGMGSPAESAILEAVVVDTDDVCEDDPCAEVGPDTPVDEVPDDCDVPVSEGSECFHGRFRADPAQAEAYLTATYAGLTAGASEYRSGEIYVTLRPDGTYVQELSGVVMAGESPDGLIESSFDLFVEGDYVFDDTTFSALATRITQFNQVTIDGVGPDGIPQVIEPPANEADRATFGYVCTGSDLVIDADDALFAGFPTDYDRVG